jgi:hypothetical protein
VNTKSLARLYDRLMPWERLPLLLAALHRGDDTEAQRLSQSAPRLLLSLPNYHGLNDGLSLLTLFHVLGQLERGLLYWQLTSTAADWEQFLVGPADQDRIERLWGLARLTAYRLGLEADGWAQFCEGLHLDGEALLRDLPCYDTLRCTQQAARALAWSAEEAADCLRRLGPDDAALPTAEGVARALLQFLEERVAWWDSDG